MKADPSRWIGPQNSLAISVVILGAVLSTAEYSDLTTQDKSAPEVNITHIDVRHVDHGLDDGNNTAEYEKAGEGILFTEPRMNVNSDKNSAPTDKMGAYTKSTPSTTITRVTTRHFDGKPTNTMTPALSKTSSSEVKPLGDDQTSRETNPSDVNDTPKHSSYTLNDTATVLNNPPKDSNVSSSDITSTSSSSTTSLSTTAASTIIIGLKASQTELLNTSMRITPTATVKHESIKPKTSSTPTRLRPLRGYPLHAFHGIIWEREYVHTALVPVMIGIFGAVCLVSAMFSLRVCRQHICLIIKEDEETLQSQPDTRQLLECQPEETV